MVLLLVGSLEIDLRYFKSLLIVARIHLEQGVNLPVLYQGVERQEHMWPHILNRLCKLSCIQMSVSVLLADTVDYSLFWHRTCCYLGAVIISKHGI